jgi:hypothetical protein
MMAGTKRSGLLLIFLAVTLGFLMLLPRVGEATILEFRLDTEFSGGTPPAGPTPWLTATFDDEALDLGSDEVRLTLDATNLTGSEFVSAWYFNLDPALDPASLTFTYDSGIMAEVSTTPPEKKNKFKADGDGYFDMKFEFPTSNKEPELRFSVGDTSVYIISGIVGLTADSFDFFSESKNSRGLKDAAHVQGIGPDGEDSGWITSTPEPGTMLLFGTGLVGLAGLGRKRFFKK